ncbi:hypothetical protein [Rhizobium sp. AAP43]|uniref:hypothetical protein n=1 Tax=Rhizobium sp. AAP43 TaxID=1523420 RepID=UPI0006B9509D|nr:hypothetical protein [Rhizobium sp. AAP43]KPF41771.1 hypothetical protein IP76_19715 [Rhizobium sp. AAP43]
MFDPYIDSLSKLVMSAERVSRAQFDASFQHALAEALSPVVTNDYVDDCIELITLAVDDLFAADTAQDVARNHILCGIEALRDELALCERKDMPRRLAAGM